MTLGVCTLLVVVVLIEEIRLGNSSEGECAILILLLITLLVRHCTQNIYLDSNFK